MNDNVSGLTRVEDEWDQALVDRRMERGGHQINLFLLYWASFGLPPPLLPPYTYTHTTIARVALNSQKANKLIRSEKYDRLGKSACCQ